MKNEACVPLVVIMLMICFSYTSFAQSIFVSTSVPFLLVSTSPEANGQGTSSVSGITDDPFAINFNPAHLGFSSRQTNSVSSFYPSKTDWMPELGTGITFNNVVLSGGINLKEYTNLPLSIGAAYSRVELDLGTFAKTSSLSPEPTGTIHLEEHSDAFSVGVGVDYGIRAAMGVTFRKIESNLADRFSDEETGSGGKSAWSRDFGFLIHLPLAEIVAKELELKSDIAPVLDIAFGAALTNVGDKIVYIDEAQADPLPRNISIGTTLELAIKYTRTDHKLLSFSWSRQSDDILVGRDSLGSFYRGGFGDIDFKNNIIKGERTTKLENNVSYATTDLSQGWQIGIAEILFIRGGSFVGTGSRFFKTLTTQGFGLRAVGLFKLLKDLWLQDNEEISFVIAHYDLRFDRSKYTLAEPDSYSNMEFTSMSFIVNF